MRVLDVPCGEGRIAGRLARHGCDVLGIDTNEHFLALACARHPEATFEQRDMCALDHCASPRTAQPGGISQIGVALAVARGASLSVCRR